MTRCAGCFLKEDDDRVKMRCKACDMVWFCSERCMDGAMDGGHAVECADDNEGVVDSHP